MEAKVTRARVLGELSFGADTTTSEICERTGLARRTVQEHLHDLVSHGWVEAYRRGSAWTYRLVTSLLHGPDLIAGLWDRLDWEGESLFARIVRRSFPSLDEFKNFASVNAESYSVAMAIATYRGLDEALEAIWEGPLLNV